MRGIVFSATLALTSLAYLTIPTAWAQEPLLFDDFNDGTIDAARWKVSLPYANPPPSTAQETSGSLELFRRGIIDSIATFPSAVDLEGRFRFVGDADTLSIVFRSDLSVTNQAERRGVQVALQQNTGRVFLIPEPFATTPIAGAYPLGRDTNVNFRITDNGQTVRVYLQDFGQPVMSANITNHRGSQLSIYNLNGTTSRVRVDQFAVYPLQTSVFIDDQIVRTGRVQKSVAARVKLQTIFTNGSVYYTLDGSTPSFISSEYTGPFMLSNSVMVRAISYPNDFSSSSLSSSIEFQFRPIVRLTNETRGGGVITFEPTGPYLSNQIVTVTASPANGWQFLRWAGAISGTSPSNQVTMTNHLAIAAVFGTSASFTSIGAGRIATWPLGPIFEYGAVVRLMGIADPGNYFFRWANAVTDSFSPVTLTVTNANPGISALFSSLNANQSSLTVRVEGAGRGTVRLMPTANVFTNGQMVMLTALPDFDQVFLGWSGSISGRTNPLPIVVNGAVDIAAHFGVGVRFDSGTPRMDPDGFSFSIKGVPGFVFTLEDSTNLTAWNYLATLTNVTGLLRYEDSRIGAGTLPRVFYRVVGP